MKKTILILIIILLGGSTIWGAPGKLTYEAGTVTIKWKPMAIQVCPPGIFGSAPCKYPELPEIILKIRDLLLNIAPLALVILITLGGMFYLLTPFNVEEMIKKGHRYIQWAIYGYILLLLISLIFTFIWAIFGGPKIVP